MTTWSVMVTWVPRRQHPALTTARELMHSIPPSLPRLKAAALDLASQARETHLWGEASYSRSHASLSLARLPQGPHSPELSLLLTLEVNDGEVTLTIHIDAQGTGLAYLWQEERVEPLDEARVREVVKAALQDLTEYWAQVEVKPGLILVGATPLTVTEELELSPVWRCPRCPIGAKLDEVLLHVQSPGHVASLLGITEEEAAQAQVLRVGVWPDEMDAQ
ncbi:hypothetical protein HRbin28_00280 [bacterium HR28]|nr:hypothetical protein HRbin28_00280 [bacterium HR28]